MPVETVARRKEELYFELLPQLKAVPEVLEHIEAQHGRIPFAVVSGSARDSVTASLAAQEQGYAYGSHLAGGILAWKAAGLPTES